MNTHKGGGGRRVNQTPYATMQSATLFRWPRFIFVICYCGSYRHQPLECRTSCLRCVVPSLVERFDLWVLENGKTGQAAWTDASIP